MHQLHDAEVAQRLLYHLAHAFGCPDAAYLAGPMRIQGGFDAAKSAVAGDSGDNRMRAIGIYVMLRRSMVVPRQVHAALSDPKNF